MTYSVHAVPLNNSNFGWVFRSPSKPISELSRVRPSVQRQGRDGVVSGFAGALAPVTLPLVVQTPREHLETLIALFSRDGGYLTVTGDSSRRAAFELLSFSYTGYGDAEAVVDATFVIRLPEGVWRDTNLTTSDPVNTGTSGTIVEVMAGLSAPVADALIRVNGPIPSNAGVGVTVTDNSGAWFKYPDVINTGISLLFTPATGRAVLQDTAADWDDVNSTVSADVIFGGPRGVFEITPTWNGTNPAERIGKLTVTHGPGGSLSSLSVRGRRAFLV